MALVIATGCVALFFLGLVFLAEWGDAQKAREREDRARRAMGVDVFRDTAPND